MLTTHYFEMTDVPASFTQDQIAYFRAQFATHVPSQGRGLNEEGFLVAAHDSIVHAALTDPGDEVLRREFQRLKKNDYLPWASFFQILQHVRDRARTLARDVSFRRQTQPRSITYAVGGEQPIAEVPSTPIMERGFRTLRNGSMAAAHIIGRFFGVTEDSQMGNTEEFGWAEVAQQSAQTSTLHFITGGQGARQYADEGDELEIHELYAGPQNSFELLGDSSSESDDNAFLREAPPEYYDVVQEPPIPVTTETELLTTRASVYTGSTDIPPYVAEQPQQPSPQQRQQSQQRQQPQRQQQAPPQQQQQQGARRRQLVPVQTVTVDNMQDFIFDPTEAYAYYLNFVKKEAKQQRRQRRQGAHGFFGGNEADQPDSGGAANITRQQSMRGGRITDAGVELRPRRKRAGRTKLERQSTLIRQKVESLPTFFPFFILGITLVQSIATITAIVFGGLAPIGAIPEVTRETTASLRSPSMLEETSYEESVNPWIGAPIPFLIKIGAKFTPCMREDHKINARNARIREEQLLDGGVGCCANGNWIGSTSPSNCAHNNASDNSTEFRKNEVCSQTDLRSLINFRPCCVSLTGRCQLLLELDCEERDGVYHAEADTCSEVNCLSGVCGMGGIPSDDNFPDQSQGNQWWRFLLPLIFHMGIIHLLVIMMIQLYIGIKIERTAGWLRVSLIYIISGIGGNLLSAIFVPYEVQFGASGSIFGLLAVIVVELIQSWQIVDRAWWELIKIAVVTVVMFALGTLPYVDNVAHVGGFVNGILAALIFIPYITFGKFDAWRKRILLIVSIPILLTLFAIQFLVFYLVQNSEFCKDCKYFDCIPYRDGLCENDFTNPDPDVA